MKIKIGLVMFLSVVMLLAPSGWGKTIGLWKDARSAINDGMLKTFSEAGWTTTILSGNDLSNEAKLAGLDVIFLPGGWNEYFFPDFPARRNLVKYVAGGKGILAGAFRSGYVRTASRPIFPQVGATYNRVNGAFISAYGDSELAKAIDRPFCPGSWDHLVVKVGPVGRVFAVNGTDPVGVYGEVNGGRYLVFGAFIGIDAGTNVMQGTERQVLLKSVEWLANAPKLSEVEKSRNQAQADLEFMRREKIWDLTLNERGPDRGPGFIPRNYFTFLPQIESRLYRFQFASQYLSGKSADLTKTEIAELQQALNELNANYKKLTSDTIAALNKMNLVELETVSSGLTNGVREKLFSDTKLAELQAKADKQLNDIKPAIKVAKAAKLALEHKADVAQLPEIIKNTASANVDVRREAVQELGRIGELQTAGTLIKLLGDSDENVRVDAIQALGWMQAKEAVPALIKALEGQDILMKRRAAQALGQIGDARAVKPLLAQIITSKEDFSENYSLEKLDYKGRDYLISENAIMALGWIKAKEAVPTLTAILTTFDQKDIMQKGLMSLAIIALGYIGDEAPLSVLEGFAKLDDAPKDRRGNKYATIYSSQAFIGFGAVANQAINLIRAGGRKEVGVKQPDFLASKKKFYALTKNFNALAGRAIGSKVGDDPNIVPAYIWEAGFTGFHNAWGAGGSDLSVDSNETYAKMVTAASDFDLNWIDVMPMDTRTEYDLNKSSGELILEKFKDESAWAGFWSEEEYGGICATANDFYTWLDKKYGKDYRKKIGVPDNYVLPFLVGGHELADTSGLLKTEYLEFCADKMLEKWRESQDWMHGRRKGCSFTNTITHRQFATFIGLTGITGEVVDAPGYESYQSFGRDNAFMAEMYKNGNARPVMAELYNWYTPDSAHAVRGFAQQLMHGECFFNFHYEHISKTPRSYLWIWDASRWGDAEKIFQKAAKIKDYINVPPSAANVAQLCSEATAAYFHKQNKNAGKMSSLGARYYQQQVGLWTALNQSQIPTDVIWAESLTPEKLQRYRVIVMSDAKILSADQAKLLRDWVEQGGVLIASGTSTLFSRLPAVQNNYMLADVFGVNYAGFAGVKDSDKNDTCGFKQGEAVVKIESSMDFPGVLNHVYRDVKPVKSLDKYTVMDSPYLPGMTKGVACEYDMPLGYDKVAVAKAEVLAKFANGDPALTVQPVGKGLCYFWTPIYPGLCYISSDWEMDANKKDFWPNVRELLGSMVKGGLVFQKANLPVDVTGVSKEVEVTLRQQPEQNRMMVHLLDYDSKSDSVKGAVLSVHPSAGKTVKRIFYPDTDTELKFKVGENGVTAQLRTFEVHDMAVVEWN